MNDSPHWQRFASSFARQSRACLSWHARSAAQTSNGRLRMLRLTHVRALGGADAR
jgi:hypothetical protein